MKASFTHVKTFDLGDGDLVEVYREDTTGQWHVVREHGNQVRSVMPWDKPQGGSAWFAHNSNAGIAYVSSGRSPSHVNRTLRHMSQEEDW